MATASKKKTASKASAPQASNKGAQPSAGASWFSPKGALVMLGAGATLGLSAPGFEQWYLAWFGLTPLILASAVETSKRKRFLLGLCFGLGYNYVYLSWYLNLVPLDWLGFDGISGMALAALAWTIVSLHQALLIGLFALIAGLIPITGSFRQKKLQDATKLPAILVLPLLYVLVVNRLGNWPDFLGVPWSMLEYTQYKQTSIIQSASVFGGIGLEWLIVAVNVTIASLIATFSGKAQFKNLQAENKETAYYHCLGMILVYGLFIVTGIWQSQNVKVAATHPVSVVQSGINIDMQKTQRRFNVEDLTNLYDRLLSKRRNELILLTESALPVFLKDSPSTMDWLCNEARSKNLDIIVGAMDKNKVNQPLNGAYAASCNGDIHTQVYHKQYLVPFGEYTPWLVNYMPEWLKRLTNTPAGGGFAPGRGPVNFHIKGKNISPLICFECISPELVARSTREGGELLVNLSDLAWFHKSNCGQQMIAFAVLRAVENRRYFVFAANSGPSAIINPKGKIVTEIGQGGELLLSGKVGFNSQLSPFTLWYR
jgi:apolipoprotein N-acyltransferase